MRKRGRLKEKEIGSDGGESKQENGCGDLSEYCTSLRQEDSILMRNS